MAAATRVRAPEVNSLPTPGDRYHPPDLVGLNRDDGHELRYSSCRQIIADDQGGAWLVSDGISGSQVAYWHPDPARRWVGPMVGTGGVYDAWLEPGRRIWFTTSSGEVLAVSI
jgi:hypothetical protein